MKEVQSDGAFAGASAADPAGRSSECIRCKRMASPLYVIARGA